MGQLLLYGYEFKLEQYANMHIIIIDAYYSFVNYDITIIMLYIFLFEVGILLFKRGCLFKISKSCDD